MNAPIEPNHASQAEPPAGQERCPICGGWVVLVHCTARCTRCHAIIDTCCEGVPVAPAKTGRTCRGPNPPQEGPRHG